ncbi:MAG TPA: ImmA/IrrE family metallo-endopeptidase [Gemmataceae bacterium]|jgi:Zn-dependent peptidase ImmA (M78 family)|nr:ImmA/IrrE family metallo-endopeptidase [Gemmataceae bacterium]
MHWNEERAMILAALERAAEQAQSRWPPEKPGPAPLREFIVAFNLTHDEVPKLCRAKVAVTFSNAGIDPPEDYWKNSAPLAGFLFANADGGYILVNADDPVPRRRFSAAHELGHFLLHFRPGDADPIGGYLQEDETIAEVDEVEDLAAMERQANHFAAELLMPEEACRRIATEAQSRGGHSPAYLEHKLAGELLVSREAARWRIRALRLD